MSKQDTKSPASDSFIGRLFNRIKPGSSYAAFPWRSWDRICTILETIRGRGIKIVRSTNDLEWELDATGNGALDRPHAYSVYVYDPNVPMDTLPAAMAEADSLTAFCYVPCLDTNANVIAGANGQNGGGKVGATAANEYPDGAHWGWISVGGVDLDKTMVVYGVLSPGANLVSPKFDSIAIANESDFMDEMVANEPHSIVVPIAWVAGTTVVQALCGRPWDVSRPPLPFDLHAVFANDGSVASVKMFLPGTPPSYVWLDDSPLPPNGQQVGNAASGWVPVQSARYYYLAFHRNANGEPDGWRVHATNTADSVLSWADGMPMVLLAVADTQGQFAPNGKKGVSQYHHGSVWISSSDDSSGGGGGGGGSGSGGDWSGDLSVDESSGGGDCVERRYVIKFKGRRAGVIDIPAPPEYAMEATDSGCAIHVSLSRTDCGESGAGSAGGFDIEKPRRFRLVRSSGDGDCTRKWKLQEIDCAGVASDESGSDEIEVPSPPTYSLSSADSGCATRLSLTKTDCGESSGESAGSVLIEKPRKFRIVKTSESGACTQKWGLKAIGCNGEDSDVSGSDEISVPVPQMKYVESIDSLSIAPSGATLTYTQVTRKGCDESRESKAVSCSIVTTECADGDSSGQ